MKPRLEVVPCDVLSQKSDLLCIFRAVNLSRFVNHLISLGIIPPESCRISAAGRATSMIPLIPIGSTNILFVDSSAVAVDYVDLVQFGVNMIHGVAQQRVRPEVISLILHGPGYGLDTDASLASIVAGLKRGLAEHPEVTNSLQRIVIAEREPNRFKRIFKMIPQLWAEPHEQRDASDVQRFRRDSVAKSAQQANQGRRIFVAMPFAEEFSDVWEYGIYNPAKRAGFICERSDKAVFTGDIVEWIKARIRTADLVIAEVSTPNANVYLEIGYSWGVEKPTIFLCKDTSALKFDIQSHRCIEYKRIKDLELAMDKELATHA